MSIQALAWTLEHSKLTGMDRLVLIALANYCDEHGFAGASKSAIARLARVSEATVRRSLSVAVEARELTRMAHTINGTLPGPTLRLREGDAVTLRVKNELDEDTSIHWHGVILPANMDGVPGLSFHGSHPGETYAYRFTVKQSGTYWYHSHSGFQEQRGVYAPLVIDPGEPEGEALRSDREHVIMLSDWTDENPDRLFRKLKKQSDYYNFRQRTVGDFFRDVRANGLTATLAERRAWGEMRMSALFVPRGHVGRILQSRRGFGLRLVFRVAHQDSPQLD